MTTTPVSRPGGTRSATILGTGRKNAIHAHWYVLCIGLGSSGCYFTFPLVEVEGNVAPVIETARPAEGVELELAGASLDVFVVVLDEDPITCTWAIDGDERGNGLPLSSGAVGCKYTLVPGDISNSGSFDTAVPHTLYVLVQDPEGLSDDASWPIVVLE